MIQTGAQFGMRTLDQDLAQLCQNGAHQASDDALAALPERGRAQAIICVQGELPPERQVEARSAGDDESADSPHFSRTDYRAGAALVGLVAFLVYLRTLAPTVMWYDMGELETTSYVLGIAHNTGYPLYILLGKLFTFLPVGDAAYRVNLMSAVFAALTVAVVFVIIHDLTRSRFAALVGSLTLAFSSTFWANANWAESYSLNAFFDGAHHAPASALARERPRLAALPGASCVFGLSLGNHRLILLLVPGILVFLWSGKAIVGRRALASLRARRSCWGYPSTSTCRFGARCTRR